MHHYFAVLLNTFVLTLAASVLHSKQNGRSIIGAALALLAELKWRSITGSGR